MQQAAAQMTKRRLETPQTCAWRRVRYVDLRRRHPLGDAHVIFGDEVALVGSANLRRAAITANQEVVVTIGRTERVQALLLCDGCRV